MKKKLLTCVLCGGLILSFTSGCGEETTNTPNDTEVKEESKGNCDVKECMTLLKPEMTLEDVNKVIGFAGEKEEGTESYIWQLTKKTKIKVEFKDGLADIHATYNKEDLKNDALKLSLCYDITNNIKTKNYTYEEVVEKLEGIEGNLENHTATSKMYSWVNKDGQTFRATFSKSYDWKISIVSIR